MSMVNCKLSSLIVDLMIQPQQEMVVSEPTKHVYHELENPEDGTTAKLPFYHELEGPTLPEVLYTCL